VNCHKAHLHLEIPNNLPKMQTKGGKYKKKIHNDRNVSYGGIIGLRDSGVLWMYFPSQ